MRARISPLWFVLALTAGTTSIPAGQTKIGPSETGLSHAADHRLTAPPPTDEDSDEVVDQASARRRVLHLRGGSVARGVTRQDNGQWEFKRGKRWEPLPNGVVTRVEDERALLASWRERNKIAGADLTLRSADAGWAFEEGLIEEGVAHLDQILDESPNHSKALAVLGAHGHRIHLPRPDAHARADDAEVEALFDWASGRTRSLRELAWIQLAGVRDRDGVTGRLEADLSSPIRSRRHLAVHALGRVAPGTSLKGLLLLSVHDPAEEIRQEAAIALGRAGEPAVCTPLLKALDSQNGHVRVRATEALGYVGHVEIVEPLMTRLKAAQAGGSAGHSVPHSYIFTGKQLAYIQDFDVEVATNVAVADPTVNVRVEGMVLEAGIRGIEEVQYVRMERAAASNALRRLTGQNPGRNAKAWLKWWEKDGAQWRAANLPTAPTAVPDEAR